jgi:hypothetical protein
MAAAAGIFPIWGAAAGAAAGDEMENGEAGAWAALGSGGCKGEGAVIGCTAGGWTGIAAAAAIKTLAVFSAAAALAASAVSTAAAVPTAAVPAVTPASAVVSGAARLT